MRKFEDYYLKNTTALKSFALKLTSNKMDADDLVQETAIKAFRSFHRFIEGSSFKSWSFTILKNLFITKYHQRKKINVVEKPLEELDYMIDYSVNNDKSERTQKLVSRIKNYISNLSHKTREPLELYLNGYQYKEIAEILSIPIGTVKSRINYGRNKIKKNFINK